MGYIVNKQQIKEVDLFHIVDLIKQTPIISRIIGGTTIIQHSVSPACKYIKNIYGGQLREIWGVCIEISNSFGLNSEPLDELSDDAFIYG
jgi:hypothetical protein